MEAHKMRKRTKLAFDHLGFTHNFDDKDAYNPSEK